MQSSHLGRRKMYFPGGAPRGAGGGGGGGGWGGVGGLRGGRRAGETQIGVGKPCRVEIGGG